jgi:hypothetical protein
LARIFFGGNFGNSEKDFEKIKVLFGTQEVLRKLLTILASVIELFTIEFKLYFDRLQPCLQVLH